MKKQTGSEPAFPYQTEIETSKSTTEHFGLTKREYFAGLAMQGILASQSDTYRRIATEEKTRESFIVEEALKFSDELIKQLNP